VLKIFGPVDKVRVSFGKAGLIALPRNYLYLGNATQSANQEFVKPKLLPSCLCAAADKAPEEPFHFASPIGE